MSRTIFTTISYSYSMEILPGAKLKRSESKGYRIFAYLSHIDNKIGVTPSAGMLLFGQ